MQALECADRKHVVHGPFRTSRSLAWTAYYCNGKAVDDSNLGPQAVRNAAGDLRRGLVRYRKHRADIDLAKHVAIGPVGIARPEHEVRVPDHRQIASRDIKQ